MTWMTNSAPTGLAKLWEVAGHDVTRLGRRRRCLGYRRRAGGGAGRRGRRRATRGEGHRRQDGDEPLRRRATGRICLQRRVREVESRRPDRQVVQRQLCITVPRLGQARTRPGNLWCGDAEAREVVETLNRHAGYDPIYVGLIERAAAQEAMVTIVFAISQEMGEFVYRWRQSNGSAPADQPIATFSPPAGSVPDLRLSGSMITPATR
jgi:8-hydroxy-5-deazaflavin:NADPH oxidoreductase